MRDYERLFDENKRLRELNNQLREEKESALSELARKKLTQHNRINDITDEANAKIASLESQLIDQKERHKAYEERAYQVMTSQEKITEKWKEEHRKSVQYFERAIKHLEVENHHMADQVIELKSKLRGMKKDTSVHDMARIGKERSSKSREKK
jgi:hypothetical protein